MRVALDAMGGDRGVEVNVQGGVIASRELGVEVLFVGREEEVKRALSGCNTEGAKYSVEHAEEVVEMDEKPARVVRRKQNSSMARVCQLVRDGAVDACVSAGNTGAFVAFAKLTFDTVTGIHKPAIALSMPGKGDKSTVLLDGGANVDCKPHHLVQFGVMGFIYAKYALGRENPAVGILSIGEEDIKGNEIVHVARSQLQELPINFVGNVEGRDIFEGDVDVVVCDGFVGNTILKACEGLAEMIEDALREELMGGVLGVLAGLLVRGRYRRFKRRVDYAEHGGAPLLGVNGACVIAHGASNPKAIANAIKVACQLVEGQVTRRIAEAIEEFHLRYNE